VLDRGLGEMEKRRHQLSDLLVQRRQEIEAWEQQIRTLEAESAAQREQAAALGASLGSAQQEVEDARSELSAVEQAIAALEEAQAGIRAEADAAQSDLGSQEVRLAELRQQGKFLAEDMAREFEAEVAGLDWRRELWKADDEPEGLRAMDLDDEPEGEDGSPATVPAADSGSAAETHEKGKRKRKARVPRGEPTEADLNALDSTDWEAVKAEIAALRQRMHGMGAVNLVAIEEYSELKQRHDFLTGQSADLTRARSELLGMIDEINRTSLRQFEVTFEQIRKNFSYTFQELFGGGRAGLELIAAEDVLESGIEIVAQPPGTRLKSISLLSGGQKTLTAVALLFALYMVKPSPFCMLDELDAPLDESNIGRFTALLGKFVKDSQFIIITHNKRTVAAADAIYGVTMEERGASKTVSMRFNHERGEAEQHSQNLAEAVSGARAGAN
jgi:chromosome segregation protein